ncbi:conserved hypothetical protein [Sulfolobus islandicus Y.N.15.51]|jgi:hypothetical protein|uniref:Uncharacterized protein n=1 Tax=Saccharolobus islandicus (strain Y.N.15.51 / Yellowstone \|nr:conserved hypothetical protein [Sulfolobus islandicus Y.N.15.51]
MRIVEDEDGERFLELENDEDIDKLFDEVIKKVKEKAKARKPSYETQPPK